MLAALAIAACAGCGDSATTPLDMSVAIPSVPAALAVPDSTLVVLLRAHATGTQNYTCTAAAAGDGGMGAPAWVFTAPEATLFDDQMKNIGSHFAGPTWQLADGSAVVGKVVAKVTMDATAIPWLLLSAASTSGSGLLTRVKYVQRLNTTAGLAPASGCDAGTIGAAGKVAYTADYYFYGAAQ
ncbi:MAG TPA: DUF3455 domain-containing protein [Polyangia bacterium]